MNIYTTRKTTRREFLRAGAGALFALGLAPGCARFADSGRGESGFSFVVLNDAHFYTENCPAFYEKVRQNILSHPARPEFCLFAGDLSEHGTQRELGSFRDVLDSFKLPWHAVPGNHDYINDKDRSGWDGVLPHSLNYYFEHRGWNIVALDTTQGTKAEKTTIQPHTIAWARENAPRLNPKQPTIIFTHFPLGPTAPKRPLNSDELLESFTPLNVVQVFGGHHHAFTERTLKQTVFVTNRCCSICRPNHDKTIEKGYFLCTAANGQITREFIEVARETLRDKPAPKKA
jgi:predicted phosphodiesterase